MAILKIKVEVCIRRLFDALNSAVDDWPENKRDQFAREWCLMENAGAEMVDVQFVGGRIVGYPSDDFTRHCAAWGVYP